MKRGSERYQTGRLEAHLVEGECLLGGNGENGGEDGLVLDLLLAVQPADAVVDDGLLRLRGHLDERGSGRLLGIDEVEHFDGGLIPQNGYKATITRKQDRSDGSLWDERNGGR